jgi:hypothetical protein
MLNTISYNLVRGIVYLGCNYLTYDQALEYIKISKNLIILDDYTKSIRRVDIGEADILVERMLFKEVILYIGRDESGVKSGVFVSKTNFMSKKNN